ncbi:hypothetical protein AMATHDRAFT_151271 [Amanita thiersii Skay4041]|uniref:Mitochondrial genome maintenance protein MGM101 n=1 Tax=Amanita thiersii Skay4041 TaxID=703135 RepID=A0A2A9NB00_9AGAR|nr:hypothetical protein AMATHDRAFT_151271 [Amanita thiersii Skay4041]
MATTAFRHFSSLSRATIRIGGVNARPLLAPHASTYIPRANFSFSPTARNNDGATQNGTSSQPAKNQEYPSTEGNHFNEQPIPDLLTNGNGEGHTDWSRSFFGLSTQPFSKEITDTLLAPLKPEDIEIKPDGLIYLPEIKYRRILNKAFGPGGWGLAPRGETNVGPKIVSREYALVCQGRLVGIARGEQEYFDPSGIPTATEGCKSNALMRCSKDLGIASELWDPRFIRGFKDKYCVEVFVEHLPTKKKKKLWRRKDQPKFGYPYSE